MKATSNNQSLPSFSKLPKSYAKLCAIHMPRVIHDNIEYETITEIIDLMAGHQLNQDQSDYLETLSELSEAYEAQNLPDIPETTPHEFLTAHLTNIGMNITAWGKLIGIDRSTASRLIRGERSLNTDHIRKTAKALNIDPALLL
jgi:antitoxin component HigA of HigAB toxin-antitoxin module